MKKWIWIIPGVFVLGWFLTRAVLKNSPTAPDVPAAETPESGSDERAKIRRFWEIYRAATEHRIAGRLPQALTAYEQALALNPRHEDGLYYLGNVYRALGHYREAQEKWQALLQINPTNTRAHFQLGDLYLYADPPAFFDPEAAAAEFRRVLAINGEESKAHLRLGGIALVRGDLAAAREHLDAVAGANPRDLEAHFLRGYIAWKEGDVGTALAALQQGLKFLETPQPASQFSQEGDTQLSPSDPGSGRYSPLFQGQIHHLSQSNPTTPDKELLKHYQTLDEFLIQIRNRTDYR